MSPMHGGGPRGGHGGGFGGGPRGGGGFGGGHHGGHHGGYHRHHHHRPPPPGGCLGPGCLLPILSVMGMAGLIAMVIGCII